MAKKKIAKKAIKKVIKKNIKKTTKSATTKSKNTNKKVSTKKTTTKTLPELKNKFVYNKTQSTIVAVLRMILGAFFFFMGLPKLIGLLSSGNPLIGYGIPLFLTWVVAIVEVFGGLALILGILRVEIGVLLLIIMIIALILTAFSGQWFEILAKLFQFFMYITVIILVMFDKDKRCSL